MVNTTTAAATARLGLAKMRKIALASVIGTTVEWYDLFVFGTASAPVFNKILFPSFNPLVGTMLAFGTFASAYPGTGLPVFARGTSCLTTKRVHGTESAINVPVTCGGVDVAPGDWVLGDDNGVIVLSLREAAAVLEQAFASDAAEPADCRGRPLLCVSAPPPRGIRRRRCSSRPGGCCPVPASADPGRC